jgi:hypothetical protein
MAGKLVPKKPLECSRTDLYRVYNGCEFVSLTVPACQTPTSTYGDSAGDDSRAAHEKQPLVNHPDGQKGRPNSKNMPPALHRVLQVFPGVTSDRLKNLTQAPALEARQNTSILVETPTPVVTPPPDLAATSTLPNILHNFDCPRECFDGVETCGTRLKRYGA